MVGRWENKPSEIVANNVKRVIFFNMAHVFWLNVANISNLGAESKEKRRELKNLSGEGEQTPVYI
jgi:hypothetical protein